MSEKKETQRRTAADSIQRLPIKSGNLQAVGYDPDRLILQVEFQSGAIYEYDGVPQGLVNALWEAPSAGSFLHAAIKPGHACWLVQDALPKSAAPADGDNVPARTDLTATEWVSLLLK